MTMRMFDFPEKQQPCAKCKDHPREVNPRPVWQCQSCGLVWITELCSLQDGNRKGWREAMQREFGAQFNCAVF